jgi:hypothetical protein
MNKKQQQTRQNEILYFIWRVKSVLIRHIETMYFKTNKRARHYLLALMKKGLLEQTTVLLPGSKSTVRPEKVYYLSYAAIQLLKKAGFEVTRYKLHYQAMHHDLTVNDILVYFINTFDGFKEFKTDYELRRELFKRKEQYRTPDFTFTDKEGRKYLVEYQLTDKSVKVVSHYVADYKSYWRGHDVLYVTRPGRVEFYKKIFQKEHLKNYHIMTYDVKNGLKTEAEG